MSLKKLDDWSKPTIFIGYEKVSDGYRAQIFLEISSLKRMEN